MSVMVDGATLLQSSKEVDNALRALYLEGNSYVRPLIERLTKSDALSSPQIDEKYNGLCQDINAIAGRIASCQKELRKQTEQFIATIDEIDRFIY